MLRAWFTLFILACILPFSFAGKSLAFTSADEFTLHIKGEESCVTQNCHTLMKTDMGIHLHSPFGKEECAECHKAKLYPNKFGLELDQSVACVRCHRNIEEEIKGSKFVHGPIKGGDCISCHDPHGSEHSFLLKQKYDELCSSCHKTKKLFSGEFVHKPVKDGNCGLCHDPHASDYRSRLTDIGANLCLLCHEDMMAGMTLEYVHTPLLKEGCTGCHDPHNGDNKLRLETSKDQLCFKCHKGQKEIMNHYSNIHEPAAEGKCLSCHSPHYSKHEELLLENLDMVCYKCHTAVSKWKSKRYPHGPVKQGNCSACHDPHGSDNSFILRLSFPYKFYTSYEKGKYDLCFLCHKETIVTSEKTNTATNFRNGEVNLHWLHVNQKKGRSCRACHDVHASDQEGRIREEFPFGNATIPMYYFKTENGGRCIPGCHRERRYDRINMINNKK